MSARAKERMADPNLNDSLSDPVLGELRRIDAFSHGKTLAVDGRELRLVLETDQGLTTEAILQARRLLSTSDDFTQRAKRSAAEALHGLKNDTWNDAEPSLSVEDISRQLCLEACEIAPDGAASLYFGDGGLF